MDWTIPGTTLQIPQQEAEHIEQRFASMFLAGGMVLSQVSAITGLEPYTVQNWVKRGFLTAPQQKRYDLNQLCRIINISMLKRTLPMEKIVALISYINGQLDDTSDDIIDDSKLYFMFLQVARNAWNLRSRAEMDSYISQVMEGYRSPVEGGRERVEKVLRIMLTAWIAAQLHEQTEKMMAEL